MEKDIGISVRIILMRRTSNSAWVGISAAAAPAMAWTTLAVIPDRVAAQAHVIPLVMAVLKHVMSVTGIS
jgi:hypothetical protein